MITLASASQTFDVPPPSTTQRWARSDCAGSWSFPSTTVRMASRMAPTTRSSGATVFTRTALGNIRLAAASREEVDAFHLAALKAGGTDNGAL